MTEYHTKTKYKDSTECPYKEKAEKHDDLMKANSEIVKQNILHTEIYQENKRLKEELRKFQVLQYTPNELEIKLNQITLLKYGYNEYNEKHFGELCDNLLATKEGDC